MQQVSMDYVIKNLKIYCKWKYKIDNLIDYNIFDKTYLIPKNYTEYLTDSYGADWETPKKFFLIKRD